MKYIINSDIDHLDENSLKNMFASEEISKKKELLNYLNSFNPLLFTSAPVIDRFTNEKVYEADNGYSDGIYTWYKSEIYYFEYYNLKLNDDFIQYVLNKLNI